MNLRSMIKKTWATGILLFGFLAYKDTATKANEILKEEKEDPK